ncbi:hypothetical protein IC620_03210 [Hazenella sp. IB182357]|uniref:Uncharacterized protein n=1 Tax=Polycladospora coralii TaxID=2771432 RepID=A0A926N7D1_9BACL|nr:hypothetical protein [Polycladospora coralii]MBD1371361.1 hypothetical protein [Polycladospora coralii]
MSKHVPKELGEWLEYYIKKQIVRLHPERDELFIAHESGQLDRYCYLPTPQLKMKIQISEISDVSIAPDGKSLFLFNPVDKQIEIRCVENLSLLRTIKNKYLNGDFLSPVGISHDGKWIFVESYMNLGGIDEQEGLVWINMETEQIHTQTWKELGYNKYDMLGYEYGYVEQMVISPDQQQLAVNEWLDGYAFLHLYSNWLAGSEKTSQTVEESPLSQFAWSANFSYITDLGYHPSSNYLILFSTLEKGRVWIDNPTQDTSVGCVGELIAVSAQERKELWRVPIDSRFTESKEGVVEGRFHNGYAGKLLVGETEVVITAPNGQLLFFDSETGSFKRKMKVNGDYIFALGWHRDGDKIRVATDQEIQVIEW